MGYRDLREFLSALDKQGFLRKITKDVDPELEITEITYRVVKDLGPALLFKNVKGSSFPVAINLFGSRERTALALGVKQIEDLSEKLSQFFKDLPRSHSGILEKLKMIPRLIEIEGFLPKLVSEGACKEVIQRNPDLTIFPILKCWPDDGGKFITFPLVFTKDPQTGIRNCGIYRMQVYDKKTTAMHFHPQKDGARHLRKAKEKLEVAVVIGSDPAVCFSAASPLLPDMDEMILAGFLRGEGVRMVRCETIDLEVPANAEIVLEGYIDPREKALEGPFGDYTGFYSRQGYFPVFHITCITHRKDPIYHATVVGPPPKEDYFIVKAIERLFLPLLKFHLPELVDYHIPEEGAFHNLMIVSIKKEYPGHAQKVMHFIWGFGQMSFTKIIIVVDDDVDVHNLRELTWKVLNNIDPQRDFEFSRGPLSILDHASDVEGFGTKLGIDATRKFKEEGFKGKHPTQVKMSEEIKAIVDKKWKELGI